MRQMWIATIQEICLALEINLWKKNRENGQKKLIYKSNDAVHDMRKKQKSISIGGGLSSQTENTVQRIEITNICSVLLQSIEKILSNYANKLRIVWII